MAEEKDLPVVDPLEEVELDEPEKFTYIGSLLSHEEKRLQLDIFAWRHSDMIRINLTMASHKLNVLPTTKPVRQKVRRFHSD